MKQIRDVMSRDPVSVAPSATVSEAATLMGARNIGSVLVMSERKLTGIFTERDVVRALASTFEAAGHLVSEWMTPAPTTVTPDSADSEALATMLDKGFRHLPVIEDSKVVGIVSIRDLAVKAG